MKIKSSFIGASHGVPQYIHKKFKLNDRYHSADLSLSFLGDYSLDVPYGITDATARRSVYYKPAISEITKQMQNAYSLATVSFTQIPTKCKPIETDVLYKKRLDSLAPETYNKRTCSEPKPTKEGIKKELETEANKRFYKLFSSNTAEKNNYVHQNLESVYTERLKHWEEVVSYFNYVESVIEARKNKGFLEKYNIEKKALEDKLYGPEDYFKEQLNGIVKDSSIPFDSLPFELEYEQKAGIVNISIDVPSDIPIPKESAQLYASGKLWIKGKSSKDYSVEKLSFYLGLPFYLASRLFNLALNINKVRVSVIETSTHIGRVWVEYEREILRQLILSQAFDLYAISNTYNHVFEYDDIEGAKRIPISQFYQKIELIKEKASSVSSMPVSRTGDNYIEFSFSDANIIASAISDNGLILKEIQAAMDNGATTVFLHKSYASILQEIKTSHIHSQEVQQDSNKVCLNSKYGPIKYISYEVTERIDELDNGYVREMKSFILNIVNTEAPISRDMLNRKICTAMGISRVSARLSEKISEIISGLHLITTNNGKIFFWSDSIRPDTYKAYRIDSNRDALDIAPEEIANCIAYNNDCTGITDASQLLRECANELGFSRMGTNVQKAMENGINAGIKNGILSRTGNSIVSNLSI